MSGAPGAGHPGDEALDRARAVAEAVEDPELPFVTLGDLGMVRRVKRSPSGPVVAVLTPTYLGCPATEAIGEAVAGALEAAGFAGALVAWELSPAWSTDDVSGTGRLKLAAAGVAPPACIGAGGLDAAIDAPVACPRCSSRRTRRMSAFGATACTAAYRCVACGEPFDLFKPL